MALNRTLSSIELPPSPQKAVFAGVLAGIGTHHGLFIHGEWHLQAPDIILVHVTALMLSLALSAVASKPDVFLFMPTLGLLWLSYLLSLFTSIGLYRIAFHRLSRARFPGPIFARLSKIWHAWACRDSRNYKVLERLNKTYGDFVRTGPNELTIFHPEVYRAIDGPGNTCNKAEWYDITHPNISLVTARDKSLHDARRRLWDRGFSKKALIQYADRVKAILDQLDHCLETDAKGEKTSDLNELLLWFSFDVMGDFVFNKSFGMLQLREWKSEIGMLQSAMALLGPFSPLPWLIHIGFRFAPGAWRVKDWMAWTGWCEQQMRERMKQSTSSDPTQEPDVAHVLIEDAKKRGFHKADWAWLNGDALLAIVAGSETVSSTLTFLFYELAKRPEDYQRIYDELQDVDLNDLQQLTSLPHLNGAIKEALRLWPQLPSGGLRQTSDRPISIGGVTVPANTTIQAPRYCISRREDCYERPLDFVPERWYAKPEMIRNGAAFAPFSIGRHACVGQHLGWIEMRLVIARIVRKYKISIPVASRSEEVLEGFQDRFTAQPGRLNLSFKMR